MADAYEVIRKLEAENASLKQRLEIAKNHIKSIGRHDCYYNCHDDWLCISCTSKQILEEIESRGGGDESVTK